MASEPPLFLYKDVSEPLLFLYIITAKMKRPKHMIPIGIKIPNNKFSLAELLSLLISPLGTDYNEPYKVTDD